MLSYFTELNRKRVPDENLAFVSHCTNPIVHAADDISVMQTLEALPFITRSVRAIYGDKPYRLGPCTIPMRQNPYGSRTMDNPNRDRIPMANRDPRHNGRFAEAFACGYAIKVLDADLECLIPAALTGPFGLIAANDEPTPEGGKRPLFNSVKALSAVAGHQWHSCLSSAPSELVSVIIESPLGQTLHLVNLTAEEQAVDISAFDLTACRRKGVVMIAEFSLTPTGGGNPAPGAQVVAEIDGVSAMRDPLPGIAPLRCGRAI